jgi:hypothetical protein
MSQEPLREMDWGVRLCFVGAILIMFRAISLRECELWAPGERERGGGGSARDWFQVTRSVTYVTATIPYDLIHLSSPTTSNQVQILALGNPPF